MITIKGYWNNIGYMGWLESIGNYRLFSCERDYLEYILEEDD